MNKRKKRVRRFYKYHKKYNFNLLNKIFKCTDFQVVKLTSGKVITEIEELDDKKVK